LRFSEGVFSWLAPCFGEKGRLQIAAGGAAFRMRPVIVFQFKQGGLLRLAQGLQTGMFNGEPDAAQKAQTIVDELGSHTATKSHSRHIHSDRLKELGVKVTALEDDQKLQDAVLTVHHACTHTLTHTPAVKIIENQNSVSFIMQIQMQVPALRPRSEISSERQIFLPKHAGDFLFSKYAENGGFASNRRSRVPSLQRFDVLCRRSSCIRAMSSRMRRPCSPAENIFGLLVIF
jgi:hypothetical protein